jgi:multidrug efflux system outer membrane protein
MLKRIILLTAQLAFLGGCTLAPSISLTGFAGSISPELSSLFSKGTGTWNFAPQITLPRFAGGRNRANLEWAELAKHVEVARYNRTIQAAFPEVSDALIARSLLTDQVAAPAARVVAEERRSHLAEVRYQQGGDSYLTVIAAQQDLFSAQQLLIDTPLFRTSNMITLYRALRGGWSTGTNPAAPETRPAVPGRMASRAQTNQTAARSRYPASITRLRQPPHPGDIAPDAGLRETSAQLPTS